MSAIGRLLGRQMGDVFGEYVLKSRETVEESPRGRTKPKPAASYIKEMQKEGVPTEEMKDLGLLDDYDPKTGLDRQKLMTKEEMLSEIDRRRAERLDSRGVYRGDIPPPIGEGETVNPRFVGGKKIIKKSPPPQFESPEPVIGTQSKQRTPMTSYNIYQQDIGDPDTYEEITYGLREGPEGKRAARRTGELSDRSVSGFYSRSADEMGLHFPERDQLFHLRLNRGKTTDGEGVTNLLELQSDIQQRAQKGTPLELKEEEATPFRPTKPEYRDPRLPMVQNWEVLGVKEAVKRAVQNGDRYLAITPGREIGRAVGAVETISTGEPLKAILVRNASGKIDVNFTGIDIRKELSDLINIDDLDVVNPKMSPDIETMLSEIGYEEYLNNPIEFAGYLDDIDNAKFENNLSILARAMITVQFDEFGYRTLDEDGIKYANALIEDFYDKLIDYSNKIADEAPEMEEFIAEITEDPIQVASLVLPESIIDRMLTIRSALEDSDAISDDVLQRVYTDEQVAKALNTNVGEVRRLADSGEAIEITPEMEFGGEGVIDFYDKALISEKRLQKYGAPLVEIEQTRPDGTTVTTNALDLKKFIDAKKKNKKAKIPYSLYSAVLGIPLAGKLGSVALSQEQTTNEEPQAMAEGGMLDEGGTVDPVSGNDVPAGSLQEEVRDDIPAQLSEGEFVFPADVVRYIGLDRLMELRQEAKQGLQKMDDMGQMGNSEEAVMSDDVPHEAMEFQQGGMVPASNIPSFYGQQQPAYMQPGAVQTAVRYAGQQQAPTQSVYQPQQFQQVPPIGPQPVPQPVQPTQPTQAPIQQVAPTEKVPYEMKRYRNAEGNIIYIPFMNGIPQFPVPEGYSEQSRLEAITGEEETEPTPTETKVETATVRGDDGGDGGPDTTTTGTAKTDAVMGIARGFSELNPNSTVATNVDKYKSAQIKGLAGAALGVFSGNILGAGVSLYRMNQKMDEYKNAAFEGLPDAVKQQLQVTVGEGQKQFITTDQFTDADAQEAFKEAKAAGASDAFAAALATSTGAFRGAEKIGGIPVTEVDIRTGQQTTTGGMMDLGAYERSVSTGLGTDVGSAQTAMLAEQEMGLFDNAADRDAFYGQEAPGRGIDAGKLSAFEAEVAAYDRERGVETLGPSFRGPDSLARGIQPMGTELGDAAAREEEGGPMGRVDRGVSINDRSGTNSRGESFSRSETRSGDTVTTTTSTNSRGETRSSSFIDSDGDGQKGSSERGVVTSSDGSPVTSRDGTPVTSRSSDEVSGGDSSSGGKIVCTAMNDSYGFGSFRQTIWLKHSAGLDPAYEKGYHRLFKPLVKYAYNSDRIGHMQLRSVLEHIARHRTADIWKQRHGKRDLIGAIERAILEPLCYLAGKIK